MPWVFLAAVVACGDPESSGSQRDLDGAADAGAAVDSRAALGDGLAADTPPECATWTECIGHPALAPQSACRKVVCLLGRCANEDNADGLACDDDDTCTVHDGCAAGKCEPGAPNACDDADPCTADACEPMAGCYHQHAASSKSCNDGHACTANDRCDAGSCMGDAIECDDGNGCTVDVCSAAKGCVMTPLLGSCSDGDPCTEYDGCEAGVCVGVQQSDAACDDDNPCTHDTCSKASGCLHDIAGKDKAACEDGNACTWGDTCIEGECTPKGKSACTCLSDADCLPFDDGDLCNGTLRCDVAALPFTCTLDVASVVSCSGASLNPCTNPQCVPMTGACKYLAKPTGSPCDADASACTAKDFCQQAGCHPGPPLDCDDGNPCTFDGCDPSSGCGHIAYVKNGDPCDADGDPCTIDDECNAGVCLAGQTTGCDDDNVCTFDICDKQFGGCVFSGAPNDEAVCVVDGDKCSTKARCLGGKCRMLQILSCYDGNTCTDDACHADHGCLYTVRPNGTPCDADASKCTGGDSCDKGVCLAGAVTPCHDFNACTLDVCESFSGKCSHDVNSLQGAPCDDGSACMIGDRCVQGECLGTGSLPCDDQNPCTEDSCQLATGCTAVQIGGVCDDGDACDGPDNCVVGVCKSGPKIVCFDGNECSNDTCSPATGCVFTDRDGACNAGGTYGTCYEQGCVADGVGGCALFDGRLAAPGVDVAYGVTAINYNFVVTGRRPLGGSSTGWMARVAGAKGGPWNRAYPESADLFGVAQVGDSDVVAVGNTSACVGWLTVVHADSGNPVVGRKLASMSVARDVATIGAEMYAVGWRTQPAQDAVIVRVDATDTSWSRVMATSGRDYGLAVARFGDRLIAAAGIMNAASDVRAGPCGSGIGQQAAGVAFVSAWTQDGERRWHTMLPPAPGAVATVTAAYDIAAAASGGLAVAGMRGGSHPSTWEMLLVRLDADGTEMWRRALAKGYAEGVAQNHGFGFAVVGGDPEKVAAGSPFLVTDASGAILATHHYSAGGYDVLARVTALSSMGFVAVGVTSTDAVGFFDARVVRTDDWGQSHCGKSGKCLAATQSCHDGNPCTLDTCAYKTGCVHTPIDQCVDVFVAPASAVAAAQDLDHDGVCTSPMCPTQAADTCPLIWNPDNDPAVCASAEAGFAHERPIRLQRAGLAVGGTAEKRAFELVELPLRNGLLDASVVARLSLAGTPTDGGLLGLPVAGLGIAAAGPDGAASGARTLGALDGVSVDKVPGARLDRLTIGLRVRPDKSADGAIARVLGSGAADVVALDRVAGQLRCSWLGVDGKARAVTATAARAHLWTGHWRHVACALTPATVAVYVDGRLITAQKIDAGPAAIGTAVRLGGAPARTGTVGRYADLALFDRALGAEELRAWSQSGLPYGTDTIPAAQPDLDDVRVRQLAGIGAERLRVPFEIVGVRAASDTAPSVAALWPLNGSGHDLAVGAKSGVVIKAQATVGRYGDAGGALRFGPGARVATGEQVTFAAGSEFGIELWARLADVADQALLGARDGSGRGFDLRVVAGGAVPVVRFAMTDHGGKSASLQGAANVVDGRWHHIAVARTLAGKPMLRLLIDGIEVAQAADQTVDAIGGGAVAPLHIGSVNVAGQADGNLTGDLDDVVVRVGDAALRVMRGRGTGLPSVRWFAATASAVGDDGAFAYLEYRLAWGRAAAKYRAISQVGADGKTRCDGLINACIGVVGWWRMRDWQTAGRDCAAAGNTATVSAVFGLGRDELSVGKADGALLTLAGDGVSTNGSFTLELGMFAPSGATGEVLTRMVAGRGMRWTLGASGLQVVVSDGVSTVQLGAALTRDTWHSVAVRRDGHLLSLTVDGAQPVQQTLKQLASIDSGGPLVLARDQLGFAGAVDELRVADRALGDEELVRHPRTFAQLGCNVAADCLPVHPCTVVRCSKRRTCAYSSKVGCQ